MPKKAKNSASKKSDNDKQDSSKTRRKSKDKDVRQLSQPEEAKTSQGNSGKKLRLGETIKVDSRKDYTLKPYLKKEAKNVPTSHYVSAELPKDAVELVGGQSVTHLVQKLYITRQALKPVIDDIIQRACCIVTGCCKNRCVCPSDIYATGQVSCERKEQHPRKDICDCAKTYCPCGNKNIIPKPATPPEVQKSLEVLNQFEALRGPDSKKKKAAKKYFYVRSSKDLINQLEALRNLIRLTIETLREEQPSPVTVRKTLKTCNIPGRASLDYNINDEMPNNLTELKKEYEKLCKNILHLKHHASESCSKVKSAASMPQMTLAGAKELILDCFGEIFQFKELLEQHAEVDTITSEKKSYHVSRQSKSDKRNGGIVLSNAGRVRSMPPDEGTTLASQDSSRNLNSFSMEHLGQSEDKKDKEKPLDSESQHGLAATSVQGAAAFPQEQIYGKLPTFNSVSDYEFYSFTQESEDMANPYFPSEASLPIIDKQEPSDTTVIVDWLSSSAVPYKPSTASMPGNEKQPSEVVIGYVTLKSSNSFLDVKSVDSSNNLTMFGKPNSRVSPQKVKLADPPSAPVYVVERLCSTEKLDCGTSSSPVQRRYSSSVPYEPSASSIPIQVNQKDSGRYVTLVRKRSVGIPYEPSIGSIPPSNINSYTFKNATFEPDKSMKNHSNQNLNLTADAPNDTVSLINKNVSTNSNDVERYKISYPISSYFSTKVKDNRPTGNKSHPCNKPPTYELRRVKTWKFRSKSLEKIKRNVNVPEHRRNRRDVNNNVSQRKSISVTKSCPGIITQDCNITQTTKEKLWSKGTCKLSILKKILEHQSTFNLMQNTPIVMTLTNTNSADSNTCQLSDTERMPRNLKELIALIQMVQHDENQHTCPVCRIANPNFSPAESRQYMAPVLSAQEMQVERGPSKNLAPMPLGSRVTWRPDHQLKSSNIDSMLSVDEQFTVSGSAGNQTFAERPRATGATVSQMSEQSSIPSRIVTSPPSRIPQASESLSIISQVSSLVLQTPSRITAPTPRLNQDSSGVLQDSSGISQVPSRAGISQSKISQDPSMPVEEEFTSKLARGPQAQDACYCRAQHPNQYRKMAVASVMLQQPSRPDTSPSELSQPAVNQPVADAVPLQSSAGSTNTAVTQSVAPQNTIGVNSSDGSQSMFQGAQDTVYFVSANGNLHMSQALARMVREPIFEGNESYDSFFQGDQSQELDSLLSQVYETTIQGDHVRREYNNYFQGGSNSGARILGRTSSSDEASQRCQHYDDSFHKKEEDEYVKSLYKEKNYDSIYSRDRNYEEAIQRDICITDSVENTFSVSNADKKSSLTSNIQTLVSDQTQTSSREFILYQIDTSSSGNTFQQLAETKNLPRLPFQIQNQTVYAMENKEEYGNDFVSKAVDAVLPICHCRDSDELGVFVSVPCKNVIKERRGFCYPESCPCNCLNTQEEAPSQHVPEVETLKYLDIQPEPCTCVPESIMLATETCSEEEEERIILPESEKLDALMEAAADTRPCEKSRVSVTVMRGGECCPCKAGLPSPQRTTFLKNAAAHGDRIMPINQPCAAVSQEVVTSSGYVQDVIGSGLVGAGPSETSNLEKVLWALARVSIFDDGTRTFEILEASPIPPGHYFLPEPDDE